IADLGIRLKGEGFDSERAAYYFHPLGMIGWLSAKSLLITAEMVDAVSAGKGRNKALLEALNKYGEIYEINTPLRIAHFLAQCAHETNFTTVSEGTKFRKKNARNTYRKYREASPDIQNSICPGSDDSYCKQPELFNFVYGGRTGNNTTGDGYTYRGRGYLQLTGKANYALYKEKHNQFSPGDIKDFVANPDLVSSNLDYAVESAYLYWRYLGSHTIHKDINHFADMGTTEDVIKKVSASINGWRGDLNGVPAKANGYDDRLLRFNAIARYLGLIK
ncbi:hypothetical protein D18P1_0311410, partial [Aggregatibacter actinomycetemcomitans serotype f str. D18P1]